MNQRAEETDAVVERRRVHGVDDWTAECSGTEERVELIEKSSGVASGLNS